MYFLPRDSALLRIDRAFKSAAASSSFVARVVSAINRVAAAWALLSRAWADLIIDMAVSVARISNSSRVRPVMSRRDFKSAICASSSRMRSTEDVEGVFELLSSPVKPTQPRKFFFSAIF
jgi:hypothetical protein